MDKIIAGAVGSFISCYICTVLIVGKLLNRREYLKMKNFFMILAAVPFLRIAGSFNMIYKIVFVISIYTIIIKLIYKRGTITTLIVCIFAYSIGMLCDIINSLLYLTILGINIEFIQQHFPMMYIMHFTFFIITLLGSLLIRPKKFFNEIEDFILKKNLFSVIQYIVFFVLFTSLLGYTVSMQPYLSKQHIVSVILLILFIIMNITYFIQIKISTKSKYDYYNIYNYTNEVEKFAKQLSKQEHEYKNRLIGIKALIEDNQYEEALEFINEIISIQKTHSDLISTNYDKICNPVLKKLLIEKTSKALNAGIKMNADVRTEIKDINIPNIALNDIVSIILDNAIDAAGRSKEKAIDIMIDEDEDEVNIIVANTYSKMVEEASMYMDGGSSNGMFRGNGLYILKQIENDNPNFTIDTTVTEELFIQEININNAKETI